MVSMQFTGEQTYLHGYQLDIDSNPLQRLTRVYDTLPVDSSDLHVARSKVNELGL